MIDGIRPPDQRRPAAMHPGHQPSEEDGQDQFAAKTAFVLIGICFLLIVGGLVFWFYNTKNGAGSAKQEIAGMSTAEKLEVEGLEFDPNKNYGNKYANGVLPVGDKKFVTNGPKKGHVYLCKPHFAAEDKSKMPVRGPWFVGENRWDVGKKHTVRGDSSFASRFTDKVANGTRTISSNALPGHPTGSFPVSPIDPSYLFDRNPYKINARELTLNLPAEPEYSSTPSCMGEEVGILLSGALLLYAFDESGRDAGAWEVQDECGGHPHASGIYHYHTMSRCINNATVRTVIGYALDGFPITGSKINAKNYLTTDDLDECHGIISEIDLDGKKVKMYHYVMTQDFPYSVSCFRGSGSKTGGLGSTGQSGSQGQSLEVQGQSNLSL